MSSEIIFEVTESPEGGYEARALGYSIYTEANSHEELKQMLQDAVRCHFEDSDERPSVIYPVGEATRDVRRILVNCRY